MAVKGVRQFVAHFGEKLALGPAGLLGSLLRSAHGLRLLEALLDALLLGDITGDG